MSYSKTSFGPGNIGNLTSGIGLTYGPTIGSNDPRSQIGSGLSGLRGCCGDGLGAGLSTLVKQAVGAATPAAMQQLNPIDRVLRPSASITGGSATVSSGGGDLIDDQYVYSDEVVVEEPQVEEPQTTQSTIPAWFWVIGGLGLFATIGGIAWYVMK